MAKTTSILSVAALLNSSAMAFNTMPTRSLSYRSSGGSVKTLLKMVAEQDEIAKLRAAAAKAREEARQLEKAMGKNVDDSATSGSTTTATAKKSTPVLSADSVRESLSSINFETGNAEIQVSTLDSLVTESKLGLWKAALTSSVNTNSPSPLRPYPVSLGFLEQRTGGKITGKSLGIIGGENDVSLDDFKYATLGVVLGSSILGVLALAFLPPNIGPTICYIAALVPILFLGVGSSAPGIIAGAIASLKGTKEEKSEQEDRVCRHEAGHFLCGYLCGLPIKGYSTNDLGVSCVEFYPSTSGDITTNVKRELSSEEIAMMSVVAMSGSVAEVLQFGVARGGANDLLELDGLMRRSSEFIGAQKQQDLTRWGALAAYNIITANNDKFEKLVNAFKERKSVSECIVALESTITTISN